MVSVYLRLLKILSLQQQQHVRKAVKGVNLLFGLLASGPYVLNEVFRRTYASDTTLTQISSRTGGGTW